MHRPRLLRFTLGCLPLCLCAAAGAQQPEALPKDIATALSTPLIDKSTADWDIRKHLLPLVHPMPQYPGAAAWASRQRELRSQILRDLFLSGWPPDAVNWRVRATETAVLHPEPAVDIHKLTLEVLPHVYATALLYVPLHAEGKAPAILNTIGHEKETGIAVPYQQTLCMDEARMGIYALSLEWIGIGDLTAPHNQHSFLAHLDLAGRRGVGLFYLEDLRALDYLAGLPGVDTARLGVTGLSGGGLQTVLLSALDTRIAVAVEVAGISPGVARVERSTDQGDFEQVDSDLLSSADYTTLLALRAPRPTMLIHNAADSCCYRAELVKPLLYDALQPFWRETPAAFAWHTNYVPGTHNYERENRYASLTFFAHNFHLPPPPEELELNLHLLTKAQIDSTLPPDSLTILDYAAQVAAATHPDASGLAEADQRSLLARITSFAATPLQHAWPLAISTQDGVEATRYRFQFANGLDSQGVFVRRLTAASDHVCILLADAGIPATASDVQSALARGDAVLSVELTLTTPALGGSVMNHSELFSSLGERSLGVSSAQLLALAQWIRDTRHAVDVRLKTTGPRSQAVSLVSHALQPRAFSHADHVDSLSTLRMLYTQPVDFRQAPELFCLDLLLHFDLADLVHLAGEESP